MNSKKFLTRYGPVIAILVGVAFVGAGFLSLGVIPLLASLAIFLVGGSLAGLGGRFFYDDHDTYPNTTPHKILIGFGAACAVVFGVLAITAAVGVALTPVGAFALGLVAVIGLAIFVCGMISRQNYVEKQSSSTSVTSVSASGSRLARSAGSLEYGSESSPSVTVERSTVDPSTSKESASPNKK